MGESSGMHLCEAARTNDGLSDPWVIVADPSGVHSENPPCVVQKAAAMMNRRAYVGQDW